jgi:moderate conductance mechanosensitive channel
MTGWLDSLTAHLTQMSTLELLSRLALTLSVFLVAWFLRRMLHRLIGRSLTPVLDKNTAQASAARFQFLTCRTITVLTIAATVPFILEIWGLHGLEWLIDHTTLVDTLIGLTVIIVLTWLSWFGVKLLVDFILSPKYGDTAARARTMNELLVSVLRFVLVVVAILLGLSELGLNIMPLIAGAGIFGIAVGFGAQSLVKDVLTGFMIVLEDSIAVGDAITVATHSGSVERVGVRSLHLRDIDGTLHIVPYSAITTVQNMSRDFGYATVDLNLALETSSEHVEAAFAEVGGALFAEALWADKILAPLEYLGIHAVGDVGAVHRARVKTKAPDRLLVRRELLRRIIPALSAKGVLFTTARPTSLMPPAIGSENR